MKTIKLAKRWPHQVNETTVHEYPAGWSGEVSNETAERAAAAGVLEGKAVDAPEGKPAKAASTKKPAAKKPAAKTPAPTPAPAPSAPTASSPEAVAAPEA